MKDFRKIATNRLHWYAGLDADATLRVYLQQRREAGEFERTWRQLYAPAQWALGHMERWGAVLSETNVRAYDAFLAGEIERHRATLVAAGGSEFADFNPRSPAQMRDLLYGRAGLRTKKRTEKTRAPSLSLDHVQAAITEKWGVPFNKATETPDLPAEELERRRGADKSLDAVLAALDVKDVLNQRSKYGIGYLKHVGYDGRVHTTYKVIRTGRLSSSEPNLQNLTSPEDKGSGVEDAGKRARGCYVPPEGWVIVSLDFAQIELRVAAILSGDERMAEGFRGGVDFHTNTARGMFALGLDQKPTEAQRRAAKVLNFAIPYGLTDLGLVPKLSFDAGVSDDQKLDRARDYIRAYERAYPQFTAWRKARVVEGAKTGQVQLQWPAYHRRRVPEIGESGDTRGADGMRRHAENVCQNTPVQAAANCLCLASMARVVAWLVDNPQVPAELNLNVHDALVMYVRRDAWQEVASEARSLMVSHETGNVPLKVDVEVGEVDYGHMRKAEI